MVERIALQEVKKALFILRDGDPRMEILRDPRVSDTTIQTLYTQIRKTQADSGIEIADLPPPSAGQIIDREAAIRAIAGAVEQFWQTIDAEHLDDKIPQGRVTRENRVTSRKKEKLREATSSQDERGNFVNAHTVHERSEVARFPRPDWEYQALTGTLHVLNYGTQGENLRQLASIITGAVISEEEILLDNGTSAPAREVFCRASSHSNGVGAKAWFVYVGSTNYLMQHLGIPPMFNGTNALLSIDSSLEQLGLFTSRENQTALIFICLGIIQDSSNKVANINNGIQLFRERPNEDHHRMQEKNIMLSIIGHKWYFRIEAGIIGKKIDEAMILAKKEEINMGYKERLRKKELKSNWFQYIAEKSQSARQGQDDGRT